MASGTQRITSRISWHVRPGPTTPCNGNQHHVRRDPFQFESTESFTPVDVSSSGVTIQVPGISTRIMYGEIVYKDKTTGVLTLGALSVTAVP